MIRLLAEVAVTCRAGDAGPTGCWTPDQDINSAASAAPASLSLALMTASRLRLRAQ
jgi:hypothetical protein